MKHEADLQQCCKKGTMTSWRLRTEPSKCSRSQRSTLQLELKRKHVSAPVSPYSGNEVKFSPMTLNCTHTTKIFKIITLYSFLLKVKQFDPPTTSVVAHIVTKSRNQYSLFFIFNMHLPHIEVSCIEIMHRLMTAGHFTDNMLAYTVEGLPTSVV